MSENEEYNELCRRIEQKRKERIAAEARIKKYDELLDRLKPVKKEIASIKYTFNYYVMVQDEYGKESSLWEGEQYQAFEREMDDVNGENKTYYHKSLDRVLDSLNDEITRIENLRLQEYGLLGDLISAINWLGNKIENFFN